MQMEPIKHQFLPLTKFLVSILFCSLVFSSSSLLPFVVNYVQFFSSNAAKNYMFLLCNGILVVLVKNSGLFSNSPDESSFDGDVKEENGNNPKKVGRLLEIKEAVVAEEKAVGEVKETEKMEDISLINAGEEEDHASLIGQDEVVGQGNGIADPDEDREEEAIELPSAEELNEKREIFTRNGIADPDEDREEEAIELPSAEELNEKREIFTRNGIADPDEDREEEAIELPSAEELNEKCEIFIRQMKERIKREARQLVVVNY